MRGAVAFLHDIDPVEASFLLEELIEEAARSRIFDPLLVPGWADDSHGVVPASEEGHEYGTRHFRRLGRRGRTPVCEAVLLARAWDDLRRKRKDEVLESRVGIVPVGARSLADAVKGVSLVLYCCDSGPDAVGALFRALSPIGNRSSAISVSVLFVGEDDLEAAASRYDAFQREFRNLYEGNVELFFAGCVAVDPEKAKACAQTGIRHFELFGGDGFMGRLKYVARGIAARLATPVDADRFVSVFSERSADQV